MKDADACAGRGPAAAALNEHVAPLDVSAVEEGMKRLERTAVQVAERTQREEKEDLVLSTEENQKL